MTAESGLVKNEMDALGWVGLVGKHGGIRQYDPCVIPRVSIELIKLRDKTKKNKTGSDDDSCCVRTPANLSDDSNDDHACARRYAHECPLIDHHVRLGNHERQVSNDHQDQSGENVSGSLT